MESLPVFLRRRRNGAAMATKDLSEVSGLSSSLISRCETGHHIPSERAAVKLERALKLQSGELKRRLRLAKTPADVLALIPRDVLEQYVNGRKAS